VVLALVAPVVAVAPVVVLVAVTPRTTVAVAPQILVQDTTFAQDATVAVAPHMPAPPVQDSTSAQDTAAAGRTVAAVVAVAPVVVAVAESAAQAWRAPRPPDPAACTAAWIAKFGIKIIQYWHKESTLVGKGISEKNNFSNIILLNLKKIIQNISKIIFEKKYAFVQKKNNINVCLMFFFAI